MDQKPNGDKNSPGKFVHNIFLEKAVQGKFAYSFGSDSPFRLLPTTSTPPSRFAKIKNPFESPLSERLHQSVFSPSVFHNMQSSKTDRKFRWAIEDISSLRPADIDEATVQQFESADHDPEVEKAAQANIEKFFSEKHIVPSPFDVAVKSNPLISESASPFKTQELINSTNSIAQTILTLPPILPEQIEEVLKPYFSYTVDQQQDRNRNCSLYCRLFDFDEEQPSPSSVLTSPAPSCNFSPIEFSPLGSNMHSHKKCGSPLEYRPMPDCNLSPITSNSAEAPPSSGGSVAARLNFSEQMWVDSSFNVVPDTLDQVPFNNQSLPFESLQSPIQEVLSNSSINWDMEYRHISLVSPANHESEMDVSNSNTPKSKIFTSQRKKLSDSFLKIDDSDIENKENICKTNEYGYAAGKSSFLVPTDNTDGGYCTGNYLTVSEDSWNSPYVFASTPTKRKN